MTRPFRHAHTTSTSRGPTRSARWPIGTLAISLAAAATASAAANWPAGNPTERVK
nr:hypothetical protein [Fodinicola feengrottensis]